LQAGLPKEIQKNALKAYRIWRQKSSPSQPSIQESSLDTSDIFRAGRPGLARRRNQKSRHDDLVLDRLT
jgi:hypothetical protein